MSVPDVFGLHVRSPTPIMIDAGAEALRQLEQGGRLLRKWDDLSNYDKRKWQRKAETVLRAALNPPSSKSK